jgi:outer membrane lipopolysaccharide assembly protein LptE/RlpB|tara:strand:+ start:213 stop:683 length:471 start_codon:yes stop_codon:yes gene_type:complete
MKYKFLNIFIFITLLTSCGFKISNQYQQSNFEILEIVTSGDERINFNLKNKLKFISTTDDSKLLKIKLDTKKIKNIKEKNARGEPAKYEINVTTTVSYSIIGELDAAKFTIIKSGDYAASNQYTNTLTNEKTLMRIITEDISNQIIKKVINRINDL